MSPSPTLKPLRHPRLWLAVWWFGVAAVMAFSLVPAFLLPQVPDGGDKIEHFLSYFLLAAAAVQVFNPRQALLRAGPGLIAMGIALEIAQGLLTSTRQMDATDALANTLGVAVGLLTLLTPWCDLLLRLERQPDRAG